MCPHWLGQISSVIKGGKKKSNQKKHLKYKSFILAYFGNSIKVHVRTARTSQFITVSLLKMNFCNAHMDVNYNYRGTSMNSHLCLIKPCCEIEAVSEEKNKFQKFMEKWRRSGIQISSA